MTSQRIHLFINALSASAGGGLTYIRNVIPHLSHRDDVRTTIVVSSALRDELGESQGVSVLSESFPDSAADRFWNEQRILPELIRHSGANILLCPGNFALFRSPIPQILLSRNALYTSTDFLRDVRERGDYRLWIDTAVKGVFARWSVLRAECSVAPSEAFAQDLRRWTGKNVTCIHHGFDSETFYRGSAPLLQEIQERLATCEKAVKILFVSHYNYYRNFETLIRAIEIARQKLRPRKIRLILTCKLVSEENPGTYCAETARELVRNLKLDEEVVELGSIPYRSLHHLYRACDLYATAAYAETFAHPLVEAMASGLPVVASDLPVHREICGDAAVYFPRFSAEALARQVVQLAHGETMRGKMKERGLQRAQDFRWSDHIEALLRIAQNLLSPDV